MRADKMRISTRAKIFLALLSLLLTLVLLGHAEAADKASAAAETRKLPPLLSVEFYQMGDADLVFSFRGKGLPMPEVDISDNTATITLREAYKDKSVDANRYSATLAPMLTDLDIQQTGRDVVVTLALNRTVQLQAMRGTEPSDVYTLRLVESEHRQRTLDEPLVTRQPQTLKTPTGPFAVDTPVTLSLRDAELRDVFGMLGVHLKKNVIIDQSLPSVLVTMSLKNVPLREAYDYLMKTYDVSYKIIGKDTLVIGTTDGLSKISGEEETRMFRIAYADPATLAPLLPRLTRIKDDKLVVDARLKTIYATSSPSILEEVAIAIQRLDHPGRQVMMHARILEFSDSAGLEVETAINSVYEHWWFNYSAAGGRGGYVDDNRVGRQYDEPTGDNPLIPITTDMTTPMQGVWREFDAAFRAVENKRRGKTLANPSVIAIDGQPATVSLTQDYPYISGRDEGGNPSWSTETVGPQMRLTPRIGRDGMITVELDIETGEVIEMIAGSTGEQMPRTSTRKVTTSVRVRNGEPFVVGGLFSENDARSTIRIPVLGSIPLLGELFTYRNNTREHSQVAIVVVPYILNTPDVAIEQERVMIRQ
jgi:type IV pilus assembly protein PilQ